MWAYLFCQPISLILGHPHQFLAECVNPPLCGHFFLVDYHLIVIAFFVKVDEVGCSPLSLHWTVSCVVSQLAAFEAGVVWAMWPRAIPLCCPQRFRALDRLRSIGTGWLLNAGGVLEELMGGIQFLMELWLVVGSGGIHPLIVCWGCWKKAGGSGLPCGHAFRQFPLFGPLESPWVPNML